jgi:hypothetical protein
MSPPSKFSTGVPEAISLWHLIAFAAADTLSHPLSEHRIDLHQPRRSRPGLSDELAARALLTALEPAWDLTAAAQDLFGLADRNDFALRVALGQIQLRNLERTTPVVERAIQALRLALEGPPTNLHGVPPTKAGG